MTSEVLQNFLAEDGTSLCYRKIPAPESNATVILIHGLASNMTRWSEFVSHTSLTETCNLIRLDLRGHGCSLCRKLIKPANWVSDLYSLIELEQAGEVILVGHSLGAQVGMFFAHKYPEQVRGLIMIDPVFPQALQGTLAKLKRYRVFTEVASRAILVLNKLGFYRRQLEYRDLHALDLRTREILRASDAADIADLYMSPLADLKYIPWTIYLQELALVVGELPQPEQISRPARVLLSAGASTSALDKMRYQLSRFADIAVKEIDADHWLLTEKPEEGRLAIEAFCHELLSRA